MTGTSRDSPYMTSVWNVLACGATVTEALRTNNGHSNLCAIQLGNDVHLVEASLVAVGRGGVNRRKKKGANFEWNAEHLVESRERSERGQAGIPKRSLAAKISAIGNWLYRDDKEVASLPPKCET